MDKIKINSAQRIVHIPEMYLGASAVHSLGQIADDLNQLLEYVGDNIPYKIVVEKTEVATIPVSEVRFDCVGVAEVLDNLLKEKKVDAFFISFKGWMELSKIVTRAGGRTRINPFDGNNNIMYRFYDENTKQAREFKFYLDSTLEGELIHAVVWKK